MKAKPAYYNVQVTDDGIVVFAFPRRKPRKSRGNPKPKIDEDGICDATLDDPDEVAARYTDWSKGARMPAITTHLNFRRLLRQLIQPQLEVLQTTLTQLDARLKSIEEKLELCLRQ